MGGKIFGVQTNYFKPPGQLGRDMPIKTYFYTQCKSNEIINVSGNFDNHDPNNGSVWYLEGSHRLGKLPIEVDEERNRFKSKELEKRKR